MEGLVNYSSEDEQDDFAYSKVAIRERGSSGGVIPGRTATDPSAPLKRSYEHSKSGSCEGLAYHKYRDVGSERFKSGHTSYEDKYKIGRRVDKSRDQREKRDSKNNRDARDDYDSSQKYDYKKLEDPKRYKEQKRESKHDSNDYYRDDKKYSRYDDKKTSYNSTNRDRFSTTKTRYEDRKQYTDRFNDDRRVTDEERRSSGGSYSEDRRKEFNNRRGYSNDEDRKSERPNDDRRPQRSYDGDRSNTYRPGHANSPLSSSHSSKSNNKYKERREDTNTKRERKRHSRSRSRSGSHSPDNSTESNFTLINSAHQKTVASKQVGEAKHPETEGEPQISEKKSLPTARNFEALLTLPLSENTPKLSNAVTAPTTGAAAGSSTTTATVQLPSYYNPNVINPNKYVEQMQKRKLIWGAKKSEDSASKWGHAQFSQDQDGKVASKFMRLMGIKTATGNGGDSSTSTNEIEKKSQTLTPSSNTDVKSREAMFSTMEQQYEVARQVTHTMRGVGLGFSSQSRPY